MYAVINASSEVNAAVNAKNSRQYLLSEIIAYLQNQWSVSAQIEYKMRVWWARVSPVNAMQNLTTPSAPSLTTLPNTPPTPSSWVSVALVAGRKNCQAHCFSTLPFLCLSPLELYSREIFESLCYGAFCLYSGTFHSLIMCSRFFWVPELWLSISK